MISLNPAKLNRCDWFIIVWVIYYLQGILYAAGSIISLALLGVNLIVSAVCALKVNQWKNNPLYFRGFNLLILMFTIYGFVHIINNPSVVHYAASGVSMQSYNYIKSIYLSLLPIYAFYYFSKKGYLTEERLKKWSYIFLFSVVLSYFRTQQEALQALADRGSSLEETTNNAGYLFLSCIPLLVLYRKKPFIQFAALAFVMAFIVMGMKRGAIAIGGIVAAYFMLQAIKNSQGKTRLAFISLSVAICFGAVYFFIYMMSSSEYMLQRIEATMEGNSSGRDDLYSFFWTYFTEKADTLHYLVGRGANGTLEIFKNYAHNDWLEIAVNQGLIGIFVFSIYWINFYKTWRQATNIDAKTIFAISLLIYFAKTLFSMSYTDMTYVSTSVLGYALSTYKNPNFD